MLEPDKLIINLILIIFTLSVIWLLRYSDALRIINLEFLDTTLLPSKVNTLINILNVKLSSSLFIWYVGTDNRGGFLMLR